MANSLKARSMTGFAQKSTDIEGQNVVLIIERRENKEKQNSKTKKTTVKK